MIFPDFLKVYGNTSFRGDCPSERAEQVAAIALIRARYPKTLGRILIHPRNEGKRSYGKAYYERAEGMTRGASDIIIPCAVPFICELKRCDHTKSRWQDGQLDYLSACADQGAFVCVALGAKGVELALDEYMEKWMVTSEKTT